jgi:hypothetical protein
MKTPLLSMSRNNNGEYWLHLTPTVGIPASINIGLCDHSDRLKDQAVVAVYSEQLKQKPMLSAKELACELFRRFGVRNEMSYLTAVEAVIEILADTATPDKAEIANLKDQLQYATDAQSSDLNNIANLRQDCDRFKRALKYAEENLAKIIKTCLRCSPGWDGYGLVWSHDSEEVCVLVNRLTAESEELKRQLQQSQTAVKSLRDEVEELDEVKRQLRESKATVELLEKLVADLRKKEEQAIKDQAQTIAIARQLEVDVARYRFLPRYRGCSDRMCGASDCPTCFPVSSQHEGMEAEPE